MGSSQVIDAENDVAGLSLSFLTIQAVRYHLSGTLPSVFGDEDWCRGAGSVI